MTTSNGNSGSMASEINVTPMIDVLLVLLIIFMVIVPALPKGEAVLAPKAAFQNSRQDGGDAVVLEVLKGAAGEASFKINQHEVARQDLAARLTAIYANRAQRVLFVKGEDKLNFSEVAQVIDLGHSAGVDHIGLMTPQTLAGQ